VKKSLLFFLISIPVPRTGNGILVYGFMAKDMQEDKKMKD
jgi:hypothetical protein